MHTHTQTRTDTCADDLSTLVRAGPHRLGSVRIPKITHHVRNTPAAAAAVCQCGSLREPVAARGACAQSGGRFTRIARNQTD